MTKEELKIKKQAAINKYGFMSGMEYGLRMRNRLNAICLVYFSGNYQLKPSKNSIIGFAKTNPSKGQIRVFLKSADYQNEYEQSK